jgi:adenylate cyclase
VLVGVDDASINVLAGGRYPVPRRAIARAVDFLHRAHARAIGLDFQYFAPSLYGRPDTSVLAAAIQRAGNVVLESQLGGASATNFLSSQVTLAEPIDPLLRSSASVGVDNYQRDVDGEFRTAIIRQVGPGDSPRTLKFYLDFPAEVAAVALHQPASHVVNGIPDRMLINYVGPNDPGNAASTSFTQHQLADVVSGTDAPGLYTNKIVLIVPASLRAQTVFTTPVGDMYGGFINANALYTILTRTWMVQPDGWVNSLLVVIVGLLTTFIAGRYSMARGTAVVLLLAVGYIGLTIVLFRAARTWVYMVTPETSILLCFAGIMAFRFATEERQKRRVSELFGQYVKREIVDVLVNAPNAETALAGARRTISVLFVDIRGFTAMSEVIEPEDVVELLAVYREELTQCILDRDGTIAEYVGDECMAIWNAPRYQEDHAFLAVRAALDMIGRTISINVQLRGKGLPAIQFGIGANTGEAVVGSMGTSFRKQYGVVGDTINTGARLCSSAAGGEVVIGEAVWRLVGDRVVVEETEHLNLKGKHQSIRTFRVRGLPRGAIDGQEQ